VLRRRRHAELIDLIVVGLLDHLRIEQADVYGNLRQHRVR
jgi:hypothetical protein